MQRAALLAIPAVESRSFRVIVLKSNSSRHLRCQNAPAAIIGAKGLLDAVSKLRRARLTGLVLEGAPTRANSRAVWPRTEIRASVLPEVLPAMQAALGLAKLLERAPGDDAPVVGYHPGCADLLELIGGHLVQALLPFLQLGLEFSRSTPAATRGAFAWPAF